MNYSPNYSPIDPSNLLSFQPSIFFMAETAPNRLPADARESGGLGLTIHEGEAR